MTIDLYVALGSPPALAVLLTVKALNIPVNIKYLNLKNGEHLTPEYLKINPQHTVPTIVDDGFCLWESRAIMTYLVSKYGKGSSLYPEEPQARALVDQRLYFDIGTVYPAFMKYYYSRSNRATDSAEIETKFEDALKLLDGFLEGQKYVAGPNLTVADFSLATRISILEVVGFDYKKYTNIVRWYETVKSSRPEYEEAIEANIEAIRKIFATQK